jgi:UDP-N-acetyl-D-glucosamine dehydrogenase
MIRQMRVAVIGQGYVGLTITVGALGAGHEVVGIDLSETLISNLKSGKSHIEGITDSQIKSGLESGKYFPSASYSDISDAEVIVIAVPTPLSDAGQPDLSMLNSAADSLSSVLKKRVLIINESTSHSGTLREVIRERIEAGSPLGHLYAISPERVDPGNEKFGTKNTPRVVGGLSVEARDKAVAFYQTFCDEVVPVSSAEVAEAAKLFENTFRFINIGLVNEFAQIMKKMEIPVDEVLKAAGTKPYGFMPFHPNVGIGGHCIPVDPIYLQAKAGEFGLESRYISLSAQINQEMPGYVVGRLVEEFGPLKDKKILVLGVSYKADIADTRETPAEHVLHLLRGAGAKVSWHDPIVHSWMGENSSEVSGEFDLGLVLVAHKKLDLSGWGKAPIYTVNADSKNPSWIPLMSVRPKK